MSDATTLETMAAATVVTSPRSRRWVIVIPIMFFDFMAMSLPRAIMPGLIDAQYGSGSYWRLGLAETTHGVLGFLTTPTLGALSDTYGRKWIFIASVLGTASPPMAYALTKSLDVWLTLFAGRGLLQATYPLAFAIISDEVPAERRAAAFGLLLGLGFGGATLVGTPLGAVVARQAGTDAVFAVCLHPYLLRGPRPPLPQSKGPQMGLDLPFN